MIYDESARNSKPYIMNHPVSVVFKLAQQDEQVEEDLSVQDLHFRTHWRHNRSVASIFSLSSSVNSRLLHYHILIQHCCLLEVSFLNRQFFAVGCKYHVVSDFLASRFAMDIQVIVIEDAHKMVDAPFFFFVRS